MQLRDWRPGFPFWGKENAFQENASEGRSENECEEKSSLLVNTMAHFSDVGTITNPQPRCLHWRVDRSGAWKTYKKKKIFRNTIQWRWGAAVIYYTNSQSTIRHVDKRHRKNQTKHWGSSDSSSALSLMPCFPRRSQYVSLFSCPGCFSSEVAMIQLSGVSLSLHSFPQRFFHTCPRANATESKDLPKPPPL